jgi:hypothetical protein
MLPGKIRNIRSSPYFGLVEFETYDPAPMLGWWNSKLQLKELQKSELESAKQLGDQVRTG